MSTVIETTQRVWQLAQVSWHTRKVRKASTETERLLARRALSDLLSGMHGISMKVGQLFAEPDATDPLHQLIDSIQPLPLQTMLPILEAELGQPVAQVFRQVEASSAAASLGQVHRATLLNGETVAVKIRYPDIDEAVASELRLAGLMPGVGPVKRWGFDLGGYKNTLNDNMQRELNYQSEAQRQQAFADQVQVAGLSVPNIYSDLCSERVLVQSWASGVRLAEATQWNKKQRLLIAQTLLSTLFKSIFIAGTVHSDPHPGNAFYSLDPEGSPLVYLLDFGCMVSITELQRLALLKLIIACRDHTDLNALQAFTALGFNAKKLSYLGESLPAIAQILFKPFSVNHPFQLSDWSLGETFESLLGDQRWWFRAAGPSDLFLLMRAFQGVVTQLQQLDVSLPWWPVLQRAVGVDLIQQAQALNLPELVPELRQQNVQIGEGAYQFCVEITQQGQQHFFLDMPAEAVWDLESVIPAAVLSDIRDHEHNDMAQIVQTVRKTGIVPQNLLAFKYQGKDYRIWLE